MTHDATPLLECSSDWLWESDANGVFRYTNGRVTTILGYTPDEILGRSRTDFLSDEARQDQSCETTLLSGIPVTGLKRQFVRKDGSLVTLETNAWPRLSGEGAIRGFCGSDREITAEVSLENQLHHTLHLLNSVIDNIENLIFYKDLNYRYMGCNRAFEVFYGHSRKELVGRDDFEFMPPEAAAHFRELDRLVIEERQSVVNPQWVEYPDGRKVFLHTTAAPFYGPSGEIIGLMGNAVDITNEKLLSEKLEHQAKFDDLTGIPNRSLFMDRLEQAIKRSRRHQSRFALLFMDLDAFKAINDCFGHAYGDEVLVQVSRRLMAGVRGSDTVARLGGDEFAAVLMDIATPQDALRLAEKLIALIDDPIVFQGQTLRVTLSVGISLFPDDADESNGLLKLADDAMYAAKNLGKNRAVLA